LIILTSLITTAFVPGTAFSDSVVAGTITSIAGEKMAGVIVSARREGSTITTSVFTDETGNYYFPPLPNGQYQVWAQALT
ncbi:MAG: carboxypeptidase-like regulatory domain-containing protein, partial [Candidatus Binatia bacterium]